MGPVAAITLEINSRKYPYLTIDPYHFIFIASIPHTMSNPIDIVIKLGVDGANWATYRDKLQFMLEARGWGDHLMQINMSRSYTDAGTISGHSPVARWRMDEAAIKQILSTSIPDSIFNRVKSAANIKTLWEDLTKLMEARTKIYVMDLERRLNATRCADDLSVRDHLANLADMREKLAAAGKDIADEKFAALMLDSLPSSYRDTTTSIIIAADVGGKALSPEIVRRLVTDECQRRITEKQREEHSQTKRKRQEEVERHHHHRRRRQEPHWVESDDEQGDDHHRGHRARSVPEIWLAEEVPTEDLEIPTEGSDADEDVADLRTPLSRICLTPTIADESQKEPVVSNKQAAEEQFSEGANSRGSPTQRSVSEAGYTAEERYREGHTANQRRSSSPCKDQDRVHQNQVLYSQGHDNRDSDQTNLQRSCSQEEAQAKHCLKVEVYDSGTSHHFSPYRHHFLDYHDFPPHLATCAGKDTLQISGIGDLYVEIPNGGSMTKLLLKHVFYAPHLNFTIISVSRLVADGYTIIYQNDLCKIENQNAEIMGQIPVNAKRLFRVQHELSAATPPQQDE
jgi:hypothetical protein